MKGQTHTIQFVLFLLIGVTVWLSFLGLFRDQFGIFRKEIISAHLKLLSDHLSGEIITAFTSCRRCSSVEANAQFPEFYGGAVLTVSLNKSSDGSLTVGNPPQAFYSSSIHNFNSSVQISSQCTTPDSSCSTSEQCVQNSPFCQLTLTIDRANNNLKVV